MGAHFSKASTTSKREVETDRDPTWTCPVSVDRCPAVAVVGLSSVQLFNRMQDLRSPHILFTLDPTVRIDGCQLLTPSYIAADAAVDAMPSAECTLCAYRSSADTEMLQSAVERVQVSHCKSKLEVNLVCANARDSECTVRAFHKWLLHTPVRNNVLVADSHSAQTVFHLTHSYETFRDLFPFVCSKTTTTLPMASSSLTCHITEGIDIGSVDLSGKLWPSFIPLPEKTEDSGVLRGLWLCNWGVASDALTYLGLSEVKLVVNCTKDHPSVFTSDSRLQEDLDLCYPLPSDESLAVSATDTSQQSDLKARVLREVKMKREGVKRLRSEQPTVRLQYIRVPIVDDSSSDVLQFLGKATERMHACGGQVLVHCRHGQSRSATLVAAYLARYCKLSATQAIDHVKSHRPRVNPNAGFRRQLDLFCQKLSV